MHDRLHQTRPTAPAAAAPASACRPRRRETNLPGLPRSPIAPAPGRPSTNRCWRGCRAPTIRRSPYLKTRDTTTSASRCSMPAPSCFDILTFYQERLANESYLRTATQLRSLTELARLIGYQPAPGVAAQTISPSRSRRPPACPPIPRPRPSPFRRARRCRAYPRRARRRRRSRPPPTSSPRPTGTRCRSRPAFPGPHPATNGALSCRHHDSAQSWRLAADPRRRPASIGRPAPPPTSNGTW